MFWMRRMAWGGAEGVLAQAKDFWRAGIYLMAAVKPISFILFSYTTNKQKHVR